MSCSFFCVPLAAARLHLPLFAYFLDGFFFVRAYLTRTANYALNSSNCEKCCDGVFLFAMPSVFSYLWRGEPLLANALKKTEEKIRTEEKSINKNAFRIVVVFFSPP